MKIREKWLKVVYNVGDIELYQSTLVRTGKHKIDWIVFQ